MQYPPQMMGPPPMQPPQQQGLGGIDPTILMLLGINPVSLAPPVPPQPMGAGIILLLIGLFIVCVLLLLWFATKTSYPGTSTPKQVTGKTGDNGASAVAQTMCPADTWVTSIYGYAADHINQIGMKCSDGTDIGAMGGNTTGTQFTDTATGGYSSIGGAADSLLNEVVPVSAKYNIFEPGRQTGSYGGTGGNSYTLTCPINTRITGYAGNADPANMVHGLSIYCT